MRVGLKNSRRIVGGRVAPRCLPAQECLTVGVRCVEERGLIEKLQPFARVKLLPGEEATKAVEIFLTPFIPRERKRPELRLNLHTARQTGDKAPAVRGEPARPRGGRRNEQFGEGLLME